MSTITKTCIDLGLATLVLEYLGATLRAVSVHRPTHAPNIKMSGVYAAMEEYLPEGAWLEDQPPEVQGRVLVSRWEVRRA